MMLRAVKGPGIGQELDQKARFVRRETTTFPLFERPREEALQRLLEGMGC